MLSGTPVLTRNEVRGLVVKAAMVFLAFHLVLALALALASAHYGKSQDAGYISWDSAHFLRVAQLGYPHGLPVDGRNTVGPSEIAFFPGLPLAIAALAWLMPLVVAGAVVSLLAGVVASGAIAVVCAQVSSPRRGLVVSALWTLQPLAFVLGVPYSEGLFTAAAAICLLALYQKRWVLAGCAALVGSSVRATGLALAVACAVAALPAVRRGHWRALAAPLLAPWGALGYLLWVGRRVGRVDAWFATQSGGWHMSFDGGLSTARDASRRLVHPFVNAPSTAASVYILLAILLLVVYAVKGPWTPPMIAFVLVLFALSYGSSNALVHIPRFLLPAFPLLLPLAALAERCTVRVQVGMLGALGCFTAALGAIWLVHLPYAP